MQIEQFDTGLKNKKNIEDVEITPIQNLNNKKFVIENFRNIYGLKKINLKKNLLNIFDKDIKVNCFEPLNEFNGIDNFIEKFWNPLFDAFPDIERRENIILGGSFRDKVQVGSYSTLSGFFLKPWLGIKPNFKMINLKCCEIHEIKNERIIESHILIDVMDFLRQADKWVINPSRGSEGAWLPPFNTEGVNFFEEDMSKSKNSLQQALSMNRSLDIKPEKENISKDELRQRLINHPQKEFWHKDMIWYGPCGIGTSRSLEGFVDMHQLPFRKSFSERNYWELGHYCEIGDGKFSLCGGWYSLKAKYGSNDWLGYTADNQDVVMRVMDFYHHDEGLIRENWVPIDIVHILKQIGIDVFEKIKNTKI